jgi:septin family protein
MINGTLFKYFLLENVNLKSKLPFAIVGSNKTIEVDGKLIRARQYPWGFVNGKW